MNFHKKPNIYVSSIHLSVRDLQRSLDFYRHVLGLKVLEQTGRSARLAAGGKNVLITIEQLDNPLPREGRTAGLYHFALLLPSRKDLARFIRHIVKAGYPLQGASDHLVSEALYLSDPDGNGIEIYRDRPSREWGWNGEEVVMATEPLDVEGILSEDDGVSWDGLPHGTIMGHIHLHVSELKQSKDFYCEGLGFDLVCSYGGQALFLSTGGYHHHIGLNTWAGVGAPAPKEHSVGMIFYTMTFPSASERRAAIEKLASLGFLAREEGGSIYVKDPSGNKIELSIESGENNQ